MSSPSLGSRWTTRRGYIGNASARGLLRSREDGALAFQGGPAQRYRSRGPSLRQTALGLDCGVRSVESVRLALAPAHVVKKSSLLLSLPPGTR